MDVIADFVCPWCYIGKRRLDEALASVYGPVQINWHPFRLNPDMPAEGMAFEDYLRHKFGDPEALTPAMDQLKGLGAAAGLDLRFERIRRVPSTLPAHRLMKLAEAEGRAGELAEALYRAFFTDGRDIGNRDVLLSLAGDVGLDAAAADSHLEERRIEQIVLAEEAQARGAGVTGVPDFMVNKRLFVVGAQSESTLLGVFDRALFGEESERPVSDTIH